jgi:lipoprotein-anchoring transpeptidase ErfK/SrfK
MAAKQKGAGIVHSSKTRKTFTITRIVVNVRRQKLLAYAGQTLVYEFDCVTGRKGKETDLGRHRIYEKVQDYVSRTYKVPMPYAMFFTPDRKAIHESSIGWVWARSLGKALGVEELGVTLGSHGCVGLSHDDAKALYEKTPINTWIEVVSGNSDSGEDGEKGGKKVKR